MKKWRVFFALLLFTILLTFAPKVLASDGNTYTDSNGVVYTEYSGNYTVTGFNWTSNEIVIPEVVNGLIVNKIGDGAFYNQSLIVSVDLPDTISSIGEKAFSNCNSLTNINIPAGITCIGDSTFSGCSSLKNIIIPSDVTSIGDSAFAYCINLTNIIIPEGVTSIGNYTFSNCSKLTSIAIPESVTNIGSSAFCACDNLTNITVPKGVTSISDYTFEDCRMLTNITISEGVASIGIGSFEGCSGLTSIIIPESVMSIGKQAFWDCYCLNSITIPNRVKSISDRLLNNCVSLSSITIPDGVTSIGNNAFNGCSSLRSITIPGGVTSIGDYTFSGCSKLTDIVMPEGLTSIGGGTFFCCSSLTDIIIPDSVASIGGEAFRNCSSLKSITIPEGITSIGDWTFSYCSNLTNITIPNSVMSLGFGVFTDCSNLSSITIPSSVTYIEDSYTNSLAGLPKTTKILGYSNSYIGTEAIICGYNFESIGNAYDQIFKIKFYTNSETSIPDLLLNFGNLITNIPQLEKDGWEFGGWYTDNGTFANLFDFANTAITGDTTLYAKWTINSYNVTFNSNGGSTVANQSVYYNTQASRPKDPTMTGYTFGGWYTDNGTFTNLFDFTNAAITGDTTLYAKWTLGNIRERDINHDGKIDISDIAELARNYNNKIGQTDWNIIYDLNHDGIVDIYDLVLLSKSINTILTNSVNLNKTSDTLIVGDTDNLTVTVSPADSTYQAVTWATSDNNIVTVDSTGKVTAVKSGIATITVTTVDGNKAASCIFTIK